MRTKSIVMIMIALSLIVAISAMSFGETADASDSGSCGDNLTYNFDDVTGTLTITGSGPMYDYTANIDYYGTAPWKDYHNNIKQISISDGVTSIGEWAFSYFWNVETLNLPDSLTSINDYALFNSRIVTINIGSGLYNIGYEALDADYLLQSITVSGSNPNFSSIDGNLYNKTGTKLIQYCIGKESTTFTVPSSVDTIDKYAFAGSNLTTIDLPANLLSIGERAFLNCNNIETLEIPSKVKSITEGSMQYCDKLTNVNVATDNPYYTSLEGVLYDKNLKLLLKFPDNSSKTTYTVPSTVTKIGKCAFSSCDKLTKVTLPSSLSEIGDSAFSGCVSFKSIDLQNVSTIGTYAFNGCTNLKSVTIPGTVNWIQTGTFYGCTKLETVVIFEGVKIVERGAFTSCNAIKSLTIADSVMTIEEHAFSNLIFYLNGMEVEPTAINLAGNMWTGSGNGTLFATTTGFCIIYFDANGGTCSTTSVKTGTDGRLPTLPDASRNGYAFQGWFTEAIGGSMVTTLTTFIMDTVVYAHWFGHTSNYKITFDGNGGTSSVNTMMTNDDGKLDTIPSASRTNYKFNGWYTTPIGGTQITKATVFSGNQTVYAHWEAAETYYTIYFDGNGGTPSETKMITGADHRLSTMPTATRTNYTFEGWFTERSGGSYVPVSYVYDSDTTLYAQWKEQSSGGDSGGIDPTIIIIAGVIVTALIVVAALIIMKKR